MERCGEKSKDIFCRYLDVGIHILKDESVTHQEFELSPWWIVCELRESERFWLVLNCINVKLTSPHNYNVITLQ